MSITTAFLHLEYHQENMGNTTCTVRSSSHPYLLYNPTHHHLSGSKQREKANSEKLNTMAATVSSPWAKPGAWALDAEEHEAELQQEANTEAADFPSLATAAATKPKKKNKGQTFSLAEINSPGSKQSQSASQGLTHEDLLVLPTGPRQRSAEELDRSRLGGGFKNYGSNNRYNNNNSFGGGEDSYGSRWGSSRVSNREPSRELQPLRADEIDNWAAVKKPVSIVRGRGGGFFDSQSKADERGSWVSNKPETRSRFGFGSGFERNSSVDSLSRDRERDRDNWGRKREESTESERPRPRLVLQPRSVPLSEGAGNVAKPKGVNPFGDARPREQVLAEKGMDPKEIDEKLEAVKIGEEKTETSSSGRRGFGNGRGGFTECRSWRKSDYESSEATEQRFSAEKAENGDAEEKIQNGHAEKETENRHVEEN